MKIVHESTTHLVLKDTRKLPPKKSILWGAALLVVSIIGGFLGGQVEKLTCTRTSGDPTTGCIKQSSWFEVVPLGQQEIMSLQEVSVESDWGEDAPDVVITGSGGEIRLPSDSLATAEAFQEQLQAFMQDEEATLLVFSFSRWPAMVQILVAVVALFMGIAGVILLINGLRAGPNVWVFDTERELLTIGISQDSSDVTNPSMLEEFPLYTLGRVTMTEDRDGDFQVHVEVQRTPRTLPGYIKDRQEAQHLVNRIQALLDE